MGQSSFVWLLKQWSEKGSELGGLLRRRRGLPIRTFDSSSGNRPTYEVPISEAGLGEGPGTQSVSVINSYERTCIQDIDNIVNRPFGVAVFLRTTGFPVPVSEGSVTSEFLSDSMNEFLLLNQICSIACKHSSFLS